MFQLKNHQTRAVIEVSAGLTTFFSMVYVLAANPRILGAAGLDEGALFTATVLGTMAATLIMALYANLPFAVAPGMGLNAFFVVMVVQMGYTPAQALTAVLVSGIVFVLISLSPLRQKVLDEIPRSLQYAVGAGIGLMIAYIGLKNSGVVVFQEHGPGLGDLTAGPVRLTVLGIFVTGFLLAVRFRFAVLAGIIITSLIGLPLGVTQTEALAQGAAAWPPGIRDSLFNFDFSILKSLDFWSLVITLLLMEVADGLAGFLGLFSIMGREADSCRQKLGRAFVADSLGVVAGSLLGLSPNTAYCESGTGVAAGGRTGLTALTVAVCFGLALFISPLFLMVPTSAIAPALIVVGLMMLAQTAKIDFTDVTESFPAFTVIIMIVLTWRISDSLALGWLTYILMKVLSGQIRKLTPTVWAAGLIFLVKIFG
jgi:AGZA family xanthine/uracil permease-like MFS transporter